MIAMMDGMKRIVTQQPQQPHVCLLLNHDVMMTSLNHDFTIPVYSNHVLTWFRIFLILWNFHFIHPAAPLTCKVKEFSCVSEGVSKCLNDNLKCNGDQECDDGSDEVGCVKGMLFLYSSYLM